MSEKFIRTEMLLGAENMEKYVKKGTKIIVQTEAQQNEYKDKEGNKRTSINFIVRNWEFAESKSAQSNNATPTPAQTTSADGFYNLTNGTDEELPFFQVDAHGKQIQK